MTSGASHVDQLILTGNFCQVSLRYRETEGSLAFKMKPLFLTKFYSGVVKRIHDAFHNKPYDILQTIPSLSGPWIELITHKHYVLILIDQKKKKKKSSLLCFFLSLHHLWLTQYVVLISKSKCVPMALQLLCCYPITTSSEPLSWSFKTYSLCVFRLVFII